MILQGNQRAGARDLATHLLKDENDHVTLHELRGFISDDLHGAFDEAHAISRGTKAKQFLYSLSLNPPPEANVTTEQFEAAIDKVEERLGLTGQPRAIVFHEKQDRDGNLRRHAHAVWSRIDTENMKAIPLPYTKYKLQDISRELYQEHGWDMPKGFIHSKERDPTNYTLEEWQQAKRNNTDAKVIKKAIQDCWASSDNQNSFKMALQDRGFALARGDRRSFVVLDEFCHVYAVPKALGIKTKEVKERINHPEELPSVDEARQKIAKDMGNRLKELQKQQDKAITALQNQLEKKRKSLIKRQSEEREKLLAEQDKRRVQEVKTRQKRFKKGLHGLWDRITGKHKKIIQQNEHETRLSDKRDKREFDTLVFKQKDESRIWLDRTHQLQKLREHKAKSISQDRNQYHDIQSNQRDKFKIDISTKDNHNRKGLEI